MIISELFVRTLYFELTAMHTNKDDMTDSVAASDADHAGSVAA